MKTNTTICSTKLLSRLVALLIVSTAMVTLTACNTTEGAGRDIKSLGKGIEETANDAKN